MQVELVHVVHDVVAVCSDQVVVVVDLLLR